MTTVHEVESRADLRRFISFPYGLYRHDQYWVPPLRREVKRQLTKHPFHRYADSRYFLAYKENRVAGRIAAIVNHRYNEFQGANAGFFGYFECIEDEGTARALLETAVQALKQRGVAEVLGPASPSSNGEFGLLIDGFDILPGLIMPYHKRYYRQFLEAAGFAKCKDLFAYQVHEDELNPKALRLFERIAARQDNLRIRQYDPSRFNEEIETVLRLYNGAWERNWGFVPMTEEEFRSEAQLMRRIADPRVLLFAEVGGETVGFALSLPDINQAVRHAHGRLFPLGFLRILYHVRTIRKLRTLLLGVDSRFRDRGLDGLLVWETITRGIKAGYNVSECSWVLEDNLKIRRPIEKIGGRITQTYRVYALRL